MNTMLRSLLVTVAVVVIIGVPVGAAAASDAIALGDAMSLDGADRITVACCVLVMLGGVAMIASSLLPQPERVRVEER